MEIDKLLKEGMRHNPLALNLRFAYLTSLQPKWGGGKDAMEKIKRFIRKSRPLVDKNPMFKRLEGSDLATLADMQLNGADKNSCAKAAQMFGEALSISPRPYRYYQRAVAHLCDDRYRSALEDYDRALEGEPEKVQYMVGKGKALYYLKEYDAAKAVFDEVITLDPYNPKALAYRGYLLYNTKQIDASYHDLLDALTYGYRDSDVHKFLGYIYYYYKKNYRLARDEFKTSIALGNNKTATWYLLTASQWQERDCEFVKSARVFERECSTQGGCKNEELQWATKSADYAVRRGICTP